VQHSKIGLPMSESGQTEKGSCRAFQVCFGPDSCRAGCEVSRTGLGQEQTFEPDRQVISGTLKPVKFRRLIGHFVGSVARSSDAFKKLEDRSGYRGVGRAD